MHKSYVSLGIDTPLQNVTMGLVDNTVDKSKNQGIETHAKMLQWTLDSG